MIIKLILALLFSVGSAFAACHVSTPAGAGTRDGSNWSNSYAGLPATLIRGDTYYIASGIYTGGYRFNTPLAGTSLIAIKKAIAADHCSDVGWDATMGVGQAVWTTAGVSGAIWQFTDAGSSYWLIDGQSRDTLKSGHGFKLDNSTGTLQYGINLISNTKSNPIETVTIRYVEIAGGGVGSNSGDSFTVTSAVRDTAGVATLTVTGGSHSVYVAQSSTVVGSQIAVSGVADPSFNTQNSRVVAASDTTVSYLSLGSPATSTGGTVTGALGMMYEFDFRYAGYINHLISEYGYIHDTSDTPLQNDGTRPCNVTIQYSVFARNNANSSHHSEGYADAGSCQADSIDPSGKIRISNNVFEDIEGTGFIASVGSGPTNNLEVTRNVFMWHQGNPYRRTGIGNGVIATTSNSVAHNWLVAWNTFVNLPPGGGANILSTANIAPGSSGFTALNNLCYYPSGVVCGFSPSPTAQITNSGTSIQTASPFVDWLGEDYHLKIPLNAGAFDYGTPVPVPGGLSGTITCTPVPIGTWTCTITVKPN